MKNARSVSGNMARPRCRACGHKVVARHPNFIVGEGAIAAEGRRGIVIDANKETTRILLEDGICANIDNETTNWRPVPGLVCFQVKENQ